MSTNAMLLHLDLLPQDRPDARHLEVVADDLPLHHGAQLAIDTTMVSPLRRDGVPRPRSMTVDGASLETARRRKERRYPELSSQFGRARLLVLACEVGGRWSDETRDFLRHLAKAKARGQPFPVQRRAEAEWLLRWRVLTACSAKAFALSLLEARSCVSSDGCIPLTGEVIGDARFQPPGK